jgi:hypothetical protein
MIDAFERHDEFNGHMNLDRKIVLGMENRPVCRCESWIRAGRGSLQSAQPGSSRATQSEGLTRRLADEPLRLIRDRLALQRRSRSMSVVVVVIGR